MELQGFEAKSQQEAAVKKLQEEHQQKFATLQKEIAVEKLKTAAAIEKRREVMTKEEADDIEPPPKKNIFGGEIQPGKKELNVKVCDHP